MENKKKVSVIVPIYNVEKYLAECLKSIIKQTYKNLEIILVNDGSLDSSKDICLKYKSFDERVVYIEKENGGLSSARNAGIDISTGDFLCFIDSDDVIKENMIEELLKKQISNNADLVVCNYKLLYDNKENITNNIQHQKIEKNRNINKEEYFILLNPIIEYNTTFVVAWNKLYKKTLFDNLRYEEGRLHEDEFIIHHIIDKCQIISLTNDELYYYRIRCNSIVRTFSVKRLDAFWAFYDRFIFFKEKGYKKLSNDSLRHCCHALQNSLEMLSYNKYKNEYKKIFKELNRHYLGKKYFVLQWKKIKNILRYNMLVEQQK